MDELEKLYNSLQGKFDVGSLSDFRTKMSTTEQRKSFYNVVKSKNLDLGDYNTYESRLSKNSQPLKKKEASVSVSNLANGNSSSVVKGQGKNIPDVLNTDKVKRNFQNQAISNEVSRPKIGQEKKVETKSYSDNLLDKNTEKKNADKGRLTQGLNYKDKMKVLSKSPATKFGDLQKEEYVQKTEKQIDDERKPAFVDREYKYDNLSNLPQGKDYSIYFPNVEQFGINREDFNTYLKVNQDEAFKTLADSGTLNEYLSNINNLSDAKKMGQQQIFKVVGGYLNDRSGFLNSKLKYAKTEEEKSKIISELNTLNDNLKNWTKTNLPEFDKAMQDKIQREADDYLSSKNDTSKRKGSTNADKFGGSFFRGVAGSAMDVVASVADYLNNNDLAEEVRMNKNYMNDTYTSSLNSSVYANGKKVNYKGSNYIVSNDGRIYDADEKLDVTNISDKIGLDTDDFKKLVTQSKEETSFFSGRNATIAGGGVLGNLVTQVYGGGILGKGLRGLSVGEKSTLIGSTLVNSSMVGASVYEDTLNQLRDAGVSDNEAKSLANEASISAMAVTAVTSNFSYNPKAIQGLVGGNNIKTLTKEFIELANTQGLEVAKKTLSHKILSVAGESVKEGLGEVAQENFENFFQSLKGSEINTRINKKVLQEDYGIEDVITNSVLAFSTASALASIGSAKDYSIDNFERYKILGDNYESFSTQLNTFVESGFTTTEQAEFLKKNVENYKKYSTKIPSKVAEKDLPKVIDLLAKRDEIEVEKDNVDKSFHQEYNDELKLIDEQINGIVNPVPTPSDQQSNQQTNETIESTSPQQVYENVIAERKKLREDKLALIDEKESLEVQEQTDETQKRIAEIDAEITLIDTQISENKTKGKEAYAELQSSKQTDTVSTKEKIVEPEQEVEKSKPIQSTVVSLTIEDVNSGKANLNEEISDQELVLENIRKEYGEDSEQFKSQELIVNELLDYKNNTAFSNGEHSLRFDNENKPIVTTESGKIANETTKRKVIKEAISEGAFDQSERVLDREGLNMESEGQVIDYVIQNSQNPTEIAETITQQKEIDDSNNTRSDVETKIAEKVRNKSVKKSSFIKFGDKNQIDKRIDASYLSKNGKGLDEIAMEVETELYGDYNANQPRVTEQDVVDFILNNPSSREYWAKHESSEMQSLKENFEKYSGIPATNENLALFTNRQAENQTEVETENLPINDADLSFDDFNQELEMVYNEDFDDDLPFQKGNQNFRKLSQKAFNKLIDKLKKAFGGKNKIITTEAEFKAKLKELGLSESEIQQAVKKLGNSGKQIEFGNTNTTSISRGINTFLRKNLFDFSEHRARTGSRYIDFDNGILYGKIRISNHTKAEEGAYIGKNDFIEFTYNTDGSISIEIDTINAELTSKEVNSILNDLGFLADYVNQNAENIYNELAKLNNDADKINYLQSILPSNKLDADIIESFNNEVIETFNGVDSGKSIFESSNTLKESHQKKFKAIQFSNKRSELTKKANKQEKEAYKRFKNNEITFEEYSDIHRDIYQKLGDDIDNLQFMRTSTGNIFGAIFPDGTIYIDQNNLNANTPIHEYGHLWTNLAKEQNSEVYNQVLEIVKQDKQAMEEVRNDSAYSHLTTENQIAEEVLARQIGNIGEQNYWAKKDAGLVSKIKNAINDLFEYIKGIFGKSTPNVHQWTTEQFQNATLQELAEGISNDLLKGKQLFNASAQTSTPVQLSAQNNNQGIAPGTTVNLTPANTNHQVPTKLPEKLHKKIVELMRDKMENYKTTKQVIDVGLDYLKKQEWYKNLNQEEKNYLETNLIKHLKIGYEKTPTQKPRAEIEAEVLRELAKNKSESTILPKYKNSRDQRIAKDVIERERTKNKQKKDVVAEVEKVFKDAKEAQKAKINVSVYFKRMIANIRKNFVDNQGKSTKLLVDGGLKVVRNYIHVERGATGKAKEFYDSRAKKIYKDLSSKDVSVLNEIIMLKRIIQIDKDRIANGLPLVTHMRNLNQEKAEIYLEHLENTLGSQQFNKLNERAEMYFDAHKEMLNLLEENGVISSELKDKLISLDYQRREYIDFMKDEDGNYLEQNSTESKNAKQAIQSLTDGYDGLLVTDSEYLFSRTAQVTMNAIARNNTMLSLQKEMTAQKNRVENLKSKNPKDLTRKEKAEIKYFEQLEKQVTFDKKEAGRGFVEVNYTDQGEKKSVFMKQDFADSFRATYVAKKNGIKLLGIPAQTLKMIATGNNPTFFIVNTPRDIFTVATLSNEYGNNLLLNLFNISVGAGKNAGQMLIERGMNLFGKDYQHNAMQKYIEYGGSMEMLNTQGDIRRTKLFDLITQRLDRRTVNGVEQLVGILKLQAIQDASEMGTRLAVFERGVKNRFKKAGVKNEAEFRDLHSNKTDFEVNQLLKDIYTSAVVSARDTSDFAQKGENYSATEALIPYFNASIQAKRFLYDSMKNDPVGTSSKILQGAIFAGSGSVALGMLLLAMNLKDDDEDKNLSLIELYLKFYKGVSDYDKESYFNIPIGKNDKGEFDYFRIAKSQDLTPFFSLTEGAIIALLKEQVGDTSETEVSQRVWKTMSRNWSPLEIEIDKGNFFKNSMGTIATNMTKNPLLKGIVTYKTGYDFFRDQPLSFKNGKIDPRLEGFEKGSKVEDFYKVLGESANDSPVRMKAFVESLITTPSTNPYVGMLYGSADYIFAKEETKEKKFFNDYVKKSFSGRIFKETSNYNREKKIDELTENMMLENNREKLKQDAQFGLIADEVIAGNMSKNDAFKEIENLLENPKDIVKQKKKLNEQLSNKNVPRVVFDVKWEFNPKNKAILLMHLYGKDFNNDAVLDDKQKATKRDLMRMKAISKDTRLEYDKLIK